MNSLLNFDFENRDWAATCNGWCGQDVNTSCFRCGRSLCVPHAEQIQVGLLGRIYCKSCYQEAAKSGVGCAGCGSMNIPDAWLTYSDGICPKMLSPSSCMLNGGYVHPSSIKCEFCKLCKVCKHH